MAGSKTVRLDVENSRRIVMMRMCGSQSDIVIPSTFILYIPCTEISVENRRHCIQIDTVFTFIDVTNYCD